MLWQLIMCFLPRELKLTYLVGVMTFLLGLKIFKFHSAWTKIAAVVIEKNERKNWSRRVWFLRKPVKPALDRSA